MFTTTLAAANGSVVLAGLLAFLLIFVSVAFDLYRFVRGVFQKEFRAGLRGWNLIREVVFGLINLYLLVKSPLIIYVVLSNLFG